MARGLSKGRYPDIFITTNPGETKKESIGALLMVRLWVAVILAA